MTEHKPSTPPEPPRNIYIRQGVIRMLPTGVDTSVDGQNIDDSVSLVRPITRVLENNRQIEAVEYLRWPGERHTENVLTAHATTPPGTDSDTVNPVATALADHLPAGVGLEAATIDFQPLGNRSMRTIRLIIPKNRSLPKQAHIALNPFEYLHESLDEAGIDYLYQVIVEDANTNAYAITVRFAVTKDINIADIDLAKYYDGLTSNLHLRVPLSYLKETMTQNPKKYRIRRKLSDRRSSINKQLWNEYSEMLRGRTDFPAQLVDAVGYGKFSADAGQLDAFMRFLPATNTWSANDRDPPHIITTDIIEDAAGTTQTISDRDPDMPMPRDTVANAGGLTHQELEILTRQVLQDDGWDTKQVEQTSESIPDAVADPPENSSINLPIDPTRITTPQDTTWAYNVEIESKGPTDGSNVLTNVVRAEKQDRGVIIVTKNEEMAQRIHKQILNPFKARRDDPPAVKLYTQDKITTPKNTTPVVRDTDYDTFIESDWWLHPDGTITLEIDGEPITSGHAEDSVGTFDYDYYLDKRDDAYVIIDHTGKEVTRYSTKDRLNADWTRVHAPFVPTRLTYIDRCTILYHDDDSGILIPYVPQPSWYHPQASKRYEQAITKFLEQRTIEIEDATLTQPTIRSHMNGWYRGQIDDDGIPSNWFGRSLPDQDRIRTPDEIPGRYAISDRDWIYPPRLDSPDLPNYKLADDPE